MEDNVAIGELAGLKSLQQLTKLVLHNWHFPPDRAASFTNIQKLYLVMNSGAGNSEVLDLNCCTQLRNLYLTPVPSSLQRLVLPRGGNVQLQVLSLTSENEHLHLVLEHLSSARNLSELTLDGVMGTPENLHDSGWPAAMSNLQSLSLQQSAWAPPCQFLQYGHLTTLDLSHCMQTTLPDWFSGLTQLRVLFLDECKFAAFPASLLPLSNLQHLSMEGISPPMSVPREIACLGKWQELRQLDLSTLSGSNGQYSFDSRLHLLELGQQLRSQSVCMLFGAY